MNIVLPEPLETRLTPAQAALHFAIGLYTGGEVTLGQAAEAAGQSQGEFMRELGRRKIPLHYGVEDFAQDLVTVENLEDIDLATERLQQRPAKTYSAREVKRDLGL
jgi:predicted HTH domain antitoxin